MRKNPGRRQRRWAIFQAQKRRRGYTRGPLWLRRMLSGRRER